MVSESVCRRLEAVLAQNTYGFAPVDVGKPDIHDHEIDLPGLGGLYPFGPVVDRDRLELLVQRELLDQRLAQLGVVVHDQDFAGIRHSSALMTGISPERRCASRR